MTKEVIPGWGQQAHVIDSVHYRIHQGRFYSGGHSEAGVASDGVVEILLKTSTLPPHVVAVVAAEGKANVELFEGTTVSANGTSVSLFNHNRLSSNTPLLTMYDTPTVTADGTKISPNGFIPAGKSSDPGDVLSTFAERILDVSENYLIRITNLSNQVSDIALAIYFYEVTRDNV